MQLKKKQTAVEWLISQYIKDGSLNKEVYEQALEMEKQQIIKFTEDFIEKFTFGTYDGEVYQSKEISDYYNETYGSKGSDELGSSLEWNGEVTNGNSVEKLPNVASAKEILDFTTKQATEINWGGVVQHIPNICNCHQSNCHLINGKYICASCNKTLNVETQPITSSQTEISEHRFTEKEIRFAYMQGYNRGVNGNPNHMESYIEHLKSTKSSQTEISDEEIDKEASRIHGVVSMFFVEGAKWCREQLKTKR